MTDELIGKQIGGYVIEKRIGRGGMATVYQALQISMNRPVALKILPRELMKDDSYIQRFQREVDVVAKLEHRNIVPVYDHGEFDGQPYIAMRLMNAGSVDDLLMNGPLSPDELLKIISQIAPALDYAHTRNVLHRDLKPSNVLMDDDDGAYLTDFGIARVLGQSPGMTITTQGVVGTPSYMSPEQAQGQSLDGRSDVYSLGVMLFEMATGRRPFQSDTPYSIAVMQVMTPPPSPKSFNPKLSTAIEQVILKSMKKKREDRYQTATALAESLKMAVERPNDFLASYAHDTQPSPIPVRDMLQVTQPSAVQHQPIQPQNPQPQPAASYTSAPSPRPQPVVPLPLPHQQFTPQTGRPPVHPVERLRRKRRSGGVWMSIAVGALIGCALLSVVAIILLILANAFMNGDGDGTSATSTLQAIVTASAEALQGGFLGIDPDQNAVGTADPQPTEASESESSAGSSTTPAPLGVRSWLADGGILYFAEREAENGRNFEIFRRNLRNDDEVQLTADLHSNQYPSMSPDGLRVVFQSDRSGGDFDLYTINRSGGTPTTLTTNTLDDLYPVWSPDGEWIAFVSDTQGDGAYDLMRVRPDGSGLENLLYIDQRISHPGWNADGTRLIYVIGEPHDARTWDIGIYDFVTRTTWKLTNDNTRDSWPVFHPDGQSVLFVSGNDGEAQINRLRLDDDGMAAGLPEVVYDESEYVWGLSYTPDGQYIAFNSGGIENGPGEVYVISADDGGRTRRVLTTSGGAYITWIP